MQPRTNAEAKGPICMLLYTWTMLGTNGIWYESKKKCKFPKRPAMLTPLSHPSRAIVCGNKAIISCKVVKSWRISKRGYLLKNVYIQYTKSDPTKGLLYKALISGCCHIFLTCSYSYQCFEPVHISRRFWDLLMLLLYLRL